MGVVLSQVKAFRTMRVKREVKEMLDGENKSSGDE